MLTARAVAFALIAMTACSDGGGRAQTTSGAQAILELYSELADSAYAVPELDDRFGGRLDELLAKSPDDRVLLETTAMKHPDAAKRQNAADALLMECPDDATAHFVKSVERLKVVPPREEEALLHLSTAADLDPGNAFYDYQRALLVEKRRGAASAMEDLRRAASKVLVEHPVAGIDGLVVSLEISGRLPSDVRYLRALKLVPATDFARIRQFARACVDYGISAREDDAFAPTARYVDRLDEWIPTLAAFDARMDCYRAMADQLMIASRDEYFSPYAAKVRQWSNALAAVGSTYRQLLRELGPKKATIEGMLAERYMQKVRKLREKAGPEFESVEGFRLRDGD